MADNTFFKFKDTNYSIKGERETDRQRQRERQTDRQSVRLRERDRESDPDTLCLFIFT